MYVLGMIYYTTEDSLELREEIVYMNKFLPQHATEMILKSTPDGFSDTK